MTLDYAEPLKQQRKRKTGHEPACVQRRAASLILEILLSDLTATKLARQMKEVNPKLCVIALSTLGSRDLPLDLPYDAAAEKSASAKPMIDIAKHLLRNGSQQN